jgi:2-polyprenyl-3-methyl-5-hydroxy-6-metoxy-1,4-benzoquinol methylase
VPAIEPGYYSKKQIHCKDQLISWSHKRRFEIGLRILKDLRPQRLLDYGSGDGTFIAMACETPWRPVYVLGAELETSVLTDCRTRLRSIPHVEFCLISELAGEERRAKFDAVVCMEVLEHVTHLDEVLRQLDYVLAPGGRLIISVPVEVGLPLVVKQAVRRIAGWRNLGHYNFTSSYTSAEMLKSMFPGDRQHIVRPVYSHPDGFTFHDHKGFNWRNLRKLLQEKYVIERTAASPLSMLGTSLASQVWFVARKKPS